MILSPVPTLRRKKGTEKFVPVPCAHAAAEEGYREACPCHLCPRCDGRRAQRSLLLSSVPILRRKKGTEKLAPVTCAHVAAEKWAQAEFVLSTAPLRYEPCPQFINVSQRTLHIYFIDGCRRIKIERNNLLCEQAPTEVFRSIFAWLVTFNLLSSLITSS